MLIIHMSIHYRLQTEYFYHFLTFSINNYLFFIQTMQNILIKLLYLPYSTSTMNITSKLAINTSPIPPISSLLHIPQTKLSPLLKYS